MAIRIGMVSLGCPKNQVDAEIMLAELKARDFELVPDAALAEVILAALLRKQSKNPLTKS